MKRLLQILIINVLLLIPQPGHSQVVNESFSTSSVLAEGQWFKIAFTKEGIYRIDYSMFKQLGLTNPSDPKIFGNNSGQLSYYNDDPKPDDLKEIPTLKVKGSDGIFNEGDYLLFYGKGTNQWKYNSVSGDYDFNRHNYSDTAFYFITSGADSGKTVISVRDTLVPPNYYSASYDALFIHEIEDVNLIKSGREWYQPVSTLSGITINPGFSDIITSEKINYSIRVLARSSIPALFRLYEGANILEGILVPEVNLFNYTGMYARIAEVTGSAYSASSSPVWEMKFYNNGEQGALGWIDYIKLHGRALTTIAGSTIIFSDSRSVKSGGITEFTVKSQTEGVNIWDVTDPFNPNSVQYTKTGDLLKFIKSTNKIRTFIVFTNDKVLRPVNKSNTCSKPKPACFSICRYGNCNSSFISGLCK
jgi:hypothetical protein